MVTFQVSFSDVFGTLHMHDLKEEGESIPVTMENRQVGGKGGGRDGYRGWIMRAGVCLVIIAQWSELASFPGPAQLSVACSTVTASDGKLGRAWERG